MSNASVNADVAIVMADFASVDPMGKLNAMGGNVSVLGFDSRQGLTLRFTVAVTIRVPYRYLPAEVSLEVALLSNGEPFEVPGPTGPTSLRIAQPVSIERASASLLSTIRDHIGGSHIWVLDFGSGLPLAIGGLYEWRVRIDGDDQHDTTYPFAVVGPQPRQSWVDDLWFHHRSFDDQLGHTAARPGQHSRHPEVLTETTATALPRRVTVRDALTAAVNPAPRCRPAQWRCSHRSP